MDTLLSYPTAVACGLTLMVEYIIMVANPKLGNDILPFSVANTFMGNFFIWTVLSSSFVEDRILRVAFDLAVLFFFSKQFDLAIDNFRLALYLAIVAVGSSLAVGAATFIGFVITRWEGLLFQGTFGFGAIIMAILMRLKQKWSSELVIPAVPQLRVGHLPLAWMLAVICMRLPGWRGYSRDWPLVFWSMWVSWSYLRFHQPNPDGSVGDISEEFAFVTLFPAFTHRFLAPMFNFFYGVSVLCGFFKERELAVAAAMSEEAAPALGPAVMLTQGKKDPVAERRKAKAMKVLDAKLAALAKESTKAWTDVTGKQAAAGTEPASASMSPGPTRQELVPATFIDVDVKKEPLAVAV